MEEWRLIRQRTLRKWEAWTRWEENSTLSLPTASLLSLRAHGGRKNVAWADGHALACRLLWRALRAPGLMKTQRCRAQANRHGAASISQQLEQKWLSEYAALDCICRIKKGSRWYLSCPGCPLAVVIPPSVSPSLNPSMIKNYKKKKKTGQR